MLFINENNFLKMKMIEKLKDFILPKDIDFFGNLLQQSTITWQIVNELTEMYIKKTGTSEKLYNMIAEAKKQRSGYLKELNNALITPVDKEAISRTYVNLHWVVLSVKHLNIEINTYKIEHLGEYEIILSLLNMQMKEMSKCFDMLNKKKFNEVLDYIYEIVHLDNLVIKEYSENLAVLFEGNDMKHILQHKEILSQLKEVSKRIHFTANSLEDMVFKMN